MCNIVGWRGERFVLIKVKKIEAFCDLTLSTIGATTVECSLQLLTIDSGCNETKSDVKIIGISLTFNGTPHAYLFNLFFLPKRNLRNIKFRFYRKYIKTVSIAGDIDTATNGVKTQR